MSSRHHIVQEPDIQTLQMSLYQPELIDLCSTSDEDDWCGVTDSSYDSVLVLSESDHPLPEVPWRFGKAARNTRVGFAHLSVDNVSFALF